MRERVSERNMLKGNVLFSPPTYPQDFLSCLSMVCAYITLPTFNGTHTCSAFATCTVFATEKRSCSRLPNQQSFDYILSTCGLIIKTTENCTSLMQMSTETKPQKAKRITHLFHQSSVMLFYRDETNSIPSILIIIYISFIIIISSQINEFMW